MSANLKITPDKSPLASYSVMQNSYNVVGQTILEKKIIYEKNETAARGKTRQFRTRPI